MDAGAGDRRSKRAIVRRRRSPRHLAKGGTAVQTEEGGEIMCGRFTLATEWDVLQEYFPFEVPPGLEPLAPRYNIAPAEPIWTLRGRADGIAQLQSMRWGLVPAWAKDPSTAFINARVETVATKPAFRHAFASGRVIVPADGYYEWAEEAGGKQPYRVVDANGHPLLLAGVSSRWHGPDGPLSTVAIVTRSAAPNLTALHPRMPLILDPDFAREWLYGEAAAWLPRLVTPPDPPPLRAYPVSRRVNRAGTNDPTFIEPVGA